MTAPLADLSAAARARLTAAPANSPARKAAGCALVVLHEAKTVKGALRMLAASNLADEIRDATADLISELDVQNRTPGDQSVTGDHAQQLSPTGGTTRSTTVGPIPSSTLVELPFVPPIQEAANTNPKETTR